ncbi:hypothetical protein PS3A_30180 [Pseudomonas sp. 3A(2025)]
MVVYLLLTCLDLLGQSERYVSFDEWLSSHKEKYSSQRDLAISKLGQCIDPVEVSKALLSAYNKVYGVTNSFFGGIDKLSENARDYLFSNIRISESLICAGGKARDNSTNGVVVENQNQLKKKYLFSLRNSFTHALDQHYMSSAPMMSIFGNEAHPELADQPRASWGFFVHEGKALPFGIEQQKRGRYLYETSDLVFVLFEVLYETIGEKFDRSDIKINFFIFSIENGFCPLVASKDLDECLKLEFNAARSKWGC